jgi:hypothetical protein
VKWVTITPDWAASASLKRCSAQPPHQPVMRVLSEADVRHTIISGRHGTVAFWIVAASWIVAGTAAVLALGGGLTRLAVVLAIVATEWWLLSKVEHRFEGKHARGNAKTDLVTHFSAGIDPMAWL